MSAGRYISTVGPPEGVSDDSFTPYIVGTLSFPYPQLGNVKRETGQGCTSCVHAGYCPALYWFMRDVQDWPDDYNGIECSSWSNNLADRVLTSTPYDMQENKYRNDQGMLREAHQNTFYFPVTGSDHNQGEGL